MGLFDELRCERELPAPNCEGMLFQTKDTPSQYMDLYVIRADGTLWREVYDTEDRSDPNAEGLLRLFGMATRVNKRWEQESEFTGEIRFYESVGEAWVEFSAYFLRGNLQQLNLIADERSQKQECIGDTE